MRHNLNYILHVLWILKRILIQRLIDITDGRESKGFPGFSNNLKNLIGDTDYRCMSKPDIFNHSIESRTT